MIDHRVNSHRFRIAMLLGLTIVLALGSFWILDVVQRSLEETLPQVKRTEPDYFVEQFHFVRVAKEGQARYHISGVKLLHLPEDNRYEIQQAVVKSLRHNQAPMTMRAKRALADPNANRVELFDQVNVERPASTTAPRLQVNSDYLLVLPDDDLIKTNRPVEIRYGTSVLRGTGMVANQATREFKLASHVSGIFPPKAQP